MHQIVGWLLKELDSNTIWNITATQHTNSNNNMIWDSNTICDMNSMVIKGMG